MLMLYIALFAILVFLMLGGSFFGAPWVPTPGVDYARIEKLANLKDNQVFYDLGCGFGGLLMFLSDKYPACRLKGIEIAAFPYLGSKIRSWPRKNIAIRFGDFKQCDISEADVIYMFLTPETHLSLRSKLIRELKPQAKVIAACWGFDYNLSGSVDKAENQVSYFIYTADEIMRGAT